jgi:hypothetical protein
MCALQTKPAACHLAFSLIPWLTVRYWLSTSLPARLSQVLNVALIVAAATAPCGTPLIALGYLGEQVEVAEVGKGRGIVGVRGGCWTSTFVPLH